MTLLGIAPAASVSSTATTAGVTGHSSEHYSRRKDQVVANHLTDSWLSVSTITSHRSFASHPNQGDNKMLFGMTQSAHKSCSVIPDPITIPHRRASEKTSSILPPLPTIRRLHSVVDTARTESVHNDTPSIGADGMKKDEVIRLREVLRSKMENIKSAPVPVTPFFRKRNRDRGSRVGSEEARRLRNRCFQARKRQQTRDNIARLENAVAQAAAENHELRNKISIAQDKLMEIGHDYTVSPTAEWHEDVQQSTSLPNLESLLLKDGSEQYPIGSFSTRPAERICGDRVYRETSLPASCPMSIPRWLVEPERRDPDRHSAALARSLPLAFGGSIAGERMHFEVRHCSDKNNCNNYDDSAADQFQQDDNDNGLDADCEMLDAMGFDDDEGPGCSETSWTVGNDGLSPAITAMLNTDPVPIDNLTMQFEIGDDEQIPDNSTNKPDAEDKSKVDPSSQRCTHDDVADAAK